CDTIRSTQVNLGKVSAEILAAALNALGLNAVRTGNHVTFSNGYYNGTLTLYGQDVEKRTQAIKQGYSAEVVKSQAKKYGWQVKTTGQNKFEIQKRTI